MRVLFSVLIGLSLASPACAPPATGASDPAPDLAPVAPVSPVSPVPDDAPRSCPQPLDPTRPLVDVPSVTLRGHVTVNGVMTRSPGGAVYLRQSKASENVIPLGRSDQPLSGPVRVVPGTYDLVYYGDLASADPDFPVNVGTVLRSGVVINQSGTLDVDVPAVAFRTHATREGRTLPAEPRHYPEAVELVAPDGGGSASVGSAYEAGFTTRLVIPGTYDVHYKWSVPRKTLPIDDELPYLTNRGVVRRGVTVAPGASLDIDIPMIRLSGQITIDGQTPGGTAGVVTLRGTDGSSTFQLAKTGTTSYGPVPFVPGVYDIVYGVEWPSLDIDNRLQGLLMQDVVLRRGAALQADGTLNIDIPTVTVQGRATVNGKPVVSTDGSVFLQSEGNLIFKLGATGSAGLGPMRVFPDTYQISYGWWGLGAPGDVPTNRTARLPGLADIRQSGTLNVDIPAVLLSGRLTVNGQRLPERGGFLEAHGSAGDRVVLGQTGEAVMAPQLVVPGSYSASYGWNEVGAPAIPRNSYAALRSDIAVTSDLGLDLDVRAVALGSGRVTVNGATSLTKFGRVSLRSVGALSMLLLGTTADASVPAMLAVPGTYEVWYENLYPGEGQDIPQNRSIRTGCTVTIP